MYHGPGMATIRPWIGIAGWAVFALAVLLDLHALRCELRRNVRGSGPSGVPVVSLLIYLAICQWRQSWADFLLLAIFYGLCHFGIPAVHRRLLARTRRAP